MSLPVIVINETNATPALFHMVSSAYGAVLMGFVGNSNIFAEWKKNLPEACFQKRVTKKSQYIFIVQSLFEVLTEEERNAIILHETGHSVLKHFETLPCAGALTDETLEIEADSYAVSVSKNPQALKSALIKAVEWQMQNRIDVFDKKMLEMGSVFTPEERVQIRIEFLEKIKTERADKYVSMTDRFANLDDLTVAQA